MGVDRSRRRSAHRRECDGRSAKSLHRLTSDPADFHGPDEGFELFDASFPIHAKLDFTWNLEEMRPRHQDVGVGSPTETIRKNSVLPNASFILAAGIPERMLPARP